MSDTKTRSLIKGITWRLVGTADTIMLSYLITGDVRTALKIGVLEIFTKTILYFLHERAWLIISRRKKRESHLKSFSKAVSWRIIGTIDTIVLSFLVLTFSGSGEVEVPPIYKASAIGLAELFTKIILYYLHERVWLKVQWGRKFADDKQMENMHDHNTD